MFVDILTEKHQKKEVEGRKKAFLKTISWRIIGTLDTMLISYILTGNLKLATGIASVEVVSKMILYYFHERLWDRKQKTIE